MSCKFEKELRKSIYNEKDKESKKRYKNIINSFTKVWVSRLLWFGCLWITLSYVLAFMDKAQIAETLSGDVVKVIIATILGYLLKSFFGKREEEKMKFKRETELNESITETETDE